MFALVYSSRETAELDDLRLREIARHAGEENRRRGVTGFMCALEGDILQYLEGEREDVEALYAKIAGDKRHSVTFVTTWKKIKKRRYPEWSMRYLDTDEVWNMEVAGMLDDALWACIDPDCEDEEREVILEAFLGEVQSCRNNGSLWVKCALC